MELTEKNFSREFVNFQKKNKKYNYQVMNDYRIVGKVFNGGHGVIQFLALHDDYIIVNEPYYNKADEKALAKFFEFVRRTYKIKKVSLCYPEYYSKDLIQKAKGE